jgi:hypothetical protein
VDPNTKVGRSYNVDLSLQRELPGGVIVEAAYLGRFSRRLPQALNLASAPYMMLDSASNQSFAQAYDLIANQLRAGAAASAIASQPFFENQFPGLAKLKGTASATACSSTSRAIAARSVSPRSRTISRRSSSCAPTSVSRTTMAGLFR